MATRAEIIDVVKTKLDELSPFEDVNVDAVDMIDKVLDDSGNTIRRIVPTHLLDAVDLFTDPNNHIENADGSGLIIIGNKTESIFIRLHSLKLNQWEVPVTKTISVDDPKYKLQRYSATRGGLCKPVAVLRYHYQPSTPTFPFVVDGMVIEYFSVPAGTSHTVDYAKYVMSGPAQDLTIQTNLLVDPLAWQCAGDIYLIQEKKEQAELAYAKVQEFIKQQTL